MKKRILTAVSAGILVMITGAVNAQNTKPLSLKECVETAISNNLQVRQSAYQAQSDKINYQQAKGSQLPNLSGTVLHGINQGRSIDPYTNTYADQQINFATYSISTSVVIWNGSSIQNNIRQTELSSQASEMDWQQVKESTTINVILAYLQILSNQEQLTIAQKQLEVTRSQVDRLKILDAEGNISPSVLYDLKAQFANDELSVLTIKNQLENAKVSLAQLMNIPYNTSLQVENISAQLIPVLYDGKPDNIYEAATKQLAYIKAADLRQKSAQKRLLSAKSQLLPTLYLSGGLGSNYSSVANHLEYLNTTDVLTSNYVNISGSKIPVYSPQNNYLSQKISYGDQLTNNLNSSISIGL